MTRVALKGRVPFVILILLLAATAPLGEAPAQDAPPPPRAVAVTYVKYPLNAPLLIAKTLGMYEKEFAKDGLAVEWPELTAGPRQIEGMEVGAVQFASAISADAVITAKTEGVDVSAIGVFARAPKAFCLMTKNPEVRDVEDLKGKTVAGPKGTLMHLMLRKALQSRGMDLTDVNFVNMTVTQALSTLMAGQVDAALAAGPGRIKAENEGARLLADGQGLIKGIILIAASGSFARANPGLVERYLAVHDEALRHMAEHPIEANALIARETGIAPADVARLLPEYDFSTSVRPEDVAALDDLQDFLVSQELLSHKINVETIFWKKP